MFIFHWACQSVITHNHENTASKKRLFHAGCLDFKSAANDSLLSKPTSLQDVEEMSQYAIGLQQGLQWIQNLFFYLLSL